MLNGVSIDLRSSFFKMMKSLSKNAFGSLLAALGVVVLTTVAWFALNAWYSAEVAVMALGLCYLLCALIFQTPVWSILSGTDQNRAKRRTISSSVKGRTRVRLRP